MQTLVVNDLLPKESLWGEGDMLNWYQAEVQVAPSNLAAQLVYIRGILASWYYRGDAYKAHEPLLLQELAARTDSHDPVYQLSALIYQRLGYPKECKERKLALGEVSTANLTDWLQKLDCDKPREL